MYVRGISLHNTASAKVIPEAKEGMYLGSYPSKGPGNTKEPIRCCRC
jgi:hypothetical protein